MATEEKLMERLRAFSSDKVVPPHIRVAVAEAMDAVERMAKETDRLRRVAHCLESGVQSVVNLQSHLTRAQVREAMSDLLDRCGLDCPGMPDQSPLVSRATAAEAELYLVRNQRDNFADQSLHFHSAYVEADDKLIAAEARVAQLETALKPFAEWPGYRPNAMDSTAVWTVTIHSKEKSGLTMSDFRRARTALSQSPDRESGT